MSTPSGAQLDANISTRVFSSRGATMTGRSNIAAIVLAAGRSTRMGAANKLLADVGGKPMVRRVVEAALASAAAAGAGGDRPSGGGACGRRWPDSRSCSSHNPDYAIGLSSSLKAGIGAVPASGDGALVLLGDMPQITAAHLDRLIAAFAAGRAQRIIVPTHEGSAATRCCGRAPTLRRCCNSRATPAPSGCWPRTPSRRARGRSRHGCDLRRCRYAGGAGGGARRRGQTPRA